MRRKIVLMVVSVLFVAAIIGVVIGFSVPTEKEELITHLTYQLEGNFDHKAYENPTPGTKPNPKYFNRIIESIAVHYNYRFLTAEPVTSTTTNVTINALIQNRGQWEKEINLVPRVKKTGDFTISFPLDIAPLLILTDNINDELGVGGLPNIVLKATVHTVARTRDSVVEDDFTQTTTITLLGNTLEWNRDLALSEIGYAAGLKYEHQGNFSYTIQFRPSILFGEVTLESEIPPPLEPVVLHSSDSYNRKTIDRIDGTFSFKLESGEGLSNVVNEVEITAAVGEAGDSRQETFTLLQETKQTADLNVTFPLDIPLFYAVIQSIEKETGASSTDGQAIITATIHVIADSQFGPIDETFTQSLTVRLGQEDVGWPEVTPETKESFIEETRVVSNPGATTAKVGSVGALVMIAIVLMYTIRSYWQFKQKRISRIEADSLLIKNKHQDLVVDVEALPDIGKEMTVVELGSLGELIKTADALLKPVLHLAKPERHIYCIIDGMTRYQYVSLTKE